MTKNTEAHPDGLKPVFDRFDTDDNGLIDHDEFHRLLQALGDQAPEETLLLQFAAIDTNEDGFVTFEEFVGWWEG